MPKVCFYVLHMNYGGVEASVAQIANMLADDFDVEIVSLYDFGKIAFELDSRIKVSFLTRQVPNKQELKNALRLKKGLVRELFKASKLWLSRRRLVKRHIKNNKAEVLISTRLLFHDLVSNYAKNSQLKICQEHVDHKNNLNYINKVRKSCQNSDYLMPVSKFLRDDYKKRTDLNIKYIPHAVIIKEDHHYKPSKNLISVGRLSPEKGFLDLLKVFSLVCQQDAAYRLDIFGDGPQKDEIKQKIHDLKLTDFVKLHGFQTQDVIREQYKKSGLYVMCSHEESFGMVLIESFANKVPVMAFDSARGAKEVLDPRSGILIAERDIDQMAQSILSLSQKKLEALSQGAFGKAREYDFTKVKQEWVSFIKKAIKEKT